jgi:hypothetical protein
VEKITPQKLHPGLERAIARGVREVESNHEVPFPRELLHAAFSDEHESHEYVSSLAEIAEEIHSLSCR